MANWFKKLFGGDSEPQSPKKLKEVAKEAGIPEQAIRHKGDARKIRNDAHAAKLEKTIETRARKRPK